MYAGMAAVPLLDHPLVALLREQVCLLNTLLLHLCCAFVLLHLQENFFFDGPGRELNSKRVVLRLRFYDSDKKAVLTLKVRQQDQCALVCASKHLKFCC